MSQEFLSDQSQSMEIQKEMQKVIDLSEKNNIVFKVEGNKIMIKGDLEYTDFVFFHRPTYINTASIIISQGDNEIHINAFSGSDVVYVSVRTPTNYVSITLPGKLVHVQYENSNLILDFSPKR